MDMNKKMKELENTKYKLLLVIGTPGTGKSKVVREYSQDIGIPLIDLDMIFANTPSDKLMDEMKNFLSTYHQKVLLIDNKKTLYQ